MTNETPYVNVILPARNEEAHIERAINSIRNLDYDQSKIDITVVNNGSTDKTAEIAQRLGVTVLHVDDKTVGGIRNFGAAETSGDILAFVDADCEVKQRWLITATSLLENTNVGAVGGQCETPDSANWIERAWAPNRAKETHETDHLAASSFIIRRDLFIRLGGFDEILTAGEDDELSNRIKSDGKSLFLANDCAVVHWGYPSSIFDIITRQIWHGSNQLSTSESPFEPMLIFTHAFTLCMVVFVAALLNLSIYAVPALVSGVMLALLVACIKQYRESRALSISAVLRRTIVYFFYFVGRSIGLVVNYYKIAVMRLKRHAK